MESVKFVIENLVEYFIPFFYALWILCTLLKQIFNQKMPKAVNRISAFGFSFFFPIFTLFAPRPARSDYHLMYRYVDGFDNDGLQNVTVNYRRTFAGIFWNPHLKTQKAIITSVRSLSDIFRDLQEKGVKEKRINRAIFSSKAFLFVKKVILDDIMDKGLLRKGKIQLVIFRSDYIKDELKFVPLYLCKINI